MAKLSPLSAKQERDLMVELWDPVLADDLRAFVMFLFPWGKEGTPLAKFKEPRSWQIAELEAISEHIKNQRLVVELGQDPTVYQSATVSGRGIGKSALVSWLNMWMMSTRLGSTAITTANTETQLKTRTWAELGKWHTLSLNSHWFEKSSLALKPAEWFDTELRNQLKIDTGYYYAQGQLWSEENPDAFAGIHNHNGLLLIFDESSGIPKPIWTVSEGFFTEPVIDRYWFNFSNGRRNTGEFFECFHKNRNFWRRSNIDARKVEGTDQKVYEKIILQHGEDSDVARIEVKGEFPVTGERQFISRESVEEAVMRELEVDENAPLILGVDIARFGDDATVLRWRRGRDARTMKPVVMKGKDNMQVANEIAHQIDTHNPDAVCIDAGNGTGVIDRLREMNYKVFDIWFGAQSTDIEYVNTRTKLWADMRDWLKGGCIDGDEDLKTDLPGPEYDFSQGGDKIMLEPKEKMKKRGLASPDHGDALACTFAVKVARKDKKAFRGNRRDVRARCDSDAYGY